MISKIPRVVGRVQIQPNFRSMKKEKAGMGVVNMENNMHGQGRADA